MKQHSNLLVLCVVAVAMSEKGPDSLLAENARTLKKYVVAGVRLLTTQDGLLPVFAQVILLKKPYPKVLMKNDRTFGCKV